MAAASILFSFALVPVSFADVTNQNLVGQIQELRKIVEAQNQKITVLETKVLEGIGKSGGIPIVTEHIEKRLLDESGGYQTIGGLKMEAGATFIGQQALNANRNVNKKGSTSNDASYSIDLALEKEFSNWGRGFMHIETGDGLAGDQRTALFSTVNRDADDSDNFLKLTEAYYEQYLFDKQTGIKFGQIDSTIEMDQNEFAHDETTQFLSYMFRNSPVIDFPGNHLGTKVLIEPKMTPWIDLSGSYMDGDADGANFMNSGFMFGQINLKPTFSGENRPGNYRFYSWRNDSNHSKWLDSEITGRSGYGFGLSFDQRLTDDVGVFSRYGWQDKNVYLLENAWSTGVSIQGNRWNRKDDYLGLAFGQAYPGKNWRIEGDSLDPAIIRSADTESHLELYYSFKLNDHFTLSPNFQWIWNPYGLDTNPSSATDLTDLSTVEADFSRGTAYILGLRAQVDL
jgi:carbohydrate-selective porin OprB